jgi:ketosteroid isomerase-like protein
MKSLMLALLAAGCVATTQQNAQSEIMKAEAQLADAFTRQDVTKIDQLWGDDFVFIAPNGKVFTKQQRLAGMKPLPADATPTLINRNDQVVVRVYGNSAVATVLSSWQAANAATGDQYQATHFWVKQGGRWRMVAAQVAQRKQP